MTLVSRRADVRPNLPNVSTWAIPEVRGGSRRVFPAYDRLAAVRQQCGTGVGLRSVVRALGGSGGVRIAAPLPACPPLGWLVLMQLAAGRRSASLRGIRGDFRAGRAMQCDTRGRYFFASPERLECFSLCIAHLAALRIDLWF